MSDLFRKKSIERVTSPEQLNDYIRVSNHLNYTIPVATPGEGPVRAAVVILLAGAGVWACSGGLIRRFKPRAQPKTAKLYVMLRRRIYLLLPINRLFR